MRKIRPIALIASLLSASALIAPAPASAQEFHHPIGAGPHNDPGPGPEDSAMHGAPPGHVLAMPHGPTGFRGPNMGPHNGPAFRGGTSMRVRPFTFQHHDFARFTSAERATWQSGWWHHGWWHGRWGWWWFAGGNWWWYDAPVYPWPTYVSDVSYVEPTYESDYGYWYYCVNPPGYYPYVQTCNGPWEPVSPTPAQGYGDSGPQSGPGDEGPGPGYQGDDQGPPPGYEQGPPPGYDQGPPPGNEQGPPPGSDQGPPPPGH